MSMECIRVSVCVCVWSCLATLFTTTFVNPYTYIQRCLISHSHSDTPHLQGFIWPKNINAFTAHKQASKQNMSIYIHMAWLTNTHWRSICRSRIMYACTIFGYIQRIPYTNINTHIHIPYSHILSDMCMKGSFDVGVSKSVRAAVNELASRQASV